MIINLSPVVEKGIALRKRRHKLKAKRTPHEVLKALDMDQTWPEIFYKHLMSTKLEEPKNRGYKRKTHESHKTNKPAKKVSASH